MEPQDISNTQKLVVDRLHEIQRNAESGKFTESLAIIKEVKVADPKNIYLIAIEKQIAKICDSSLPEESRTGIVKSLPSMLDRAISDIQRRTSAPKVEEVQKEQKEAALEKLKSQYFQRADDYVEKHEYQRALEEIRRIYIIEPGSVVAKEYEQKIEQLATIHARNEAEKAASAKIKEVKAEVKETKAKEAKTKETKAEVKKPEKVIPNIEPPNEKVVVKLEEEKKSKLPILIAAAAVVVIAVGSWLFFSRSSSSNVPANQPQTQLPPVQDSVVIPTPSTASTTQPKGPASITEAVKQPVKNEKKQPEVKPVTQTQKPVQPTSQTITQPTNTKPQTTQNPPATQTQQPAQQPSTTSSTPAPVPFVAIENPPEVIRREPAKYPELAIKMGIQGRVTIEVTIDPQGKPIQTKVVKSSSEVFNDAAVEAVMKYTFKPAMQSTGPVTAKLYIPIDFRLK